MLRTLLLSVLALGSLTSVARADPCEAVPEKGPTPPHLRSGAQFAGRVVYIGDAPPCDGARPMAWFIQAFVSLALTAYAPSILT